MKITHIGHASILIEAGGITVLSDPWWKGPCFGAQWWLYPRPHLSAIAGIRPDYIYISHGHHDHFHPGTLKTFDRRTKILVSARAGLTRPLQDLGFEVVEVTDSEPILLGNTKVECRIVPTHGDDTLMTLNDGAEVCVNINDALHSAPDDVQERFIALLKNLHPRIDYLFCGYGVASHFPNCYIIPGKDREQTALKRQQYFNRKWVRLVRDLDPAFGFPFAADVVFLEEDLFWANRITHNGERPTTLFRSCHPDSAVEVIDIAPGFSIEEGTVTASVLRVPLEDSSIRQGYAGEIERANRYGGTGALQIAEVESMLRRNLAASLVYLGDYSGDYQFFIRFRNVNGGIVIKKSGRKIEVRFIESEESGAYDIVYTTRLSYLKWAMTQPYGDEILFVGSGGIFEFKDKRDAVDNLQREFLYLLRHSKPGGEARRKHQIRLVRSAKDVVKKVLGRYERDLYDLGAWTVFTK